MRRPVGHIRQRSPDSWELRYSGGIKHGKRRVITTTVRGSRRDAEKELRRLLRTIDTGEHVDPTRMTVGHWMGAWLITVKDEVAPRTHERYSEIVANFLVPELGAIPIGRLAPAHIQTAYSKWSTAGRRDGKAGGLSPRTRRHIHRILSAALVRAVAQQIIARNPTDVFRKRLPKIEPKPMRTLSLEQSARLLEAVGHTRIYWPAMLAIATGMRRGEIFALRWKHVDLDRGSLSVMQSLEQTRGGGLRFKSPKSDRTRVITLPAFAIEELRRLRRLQAEELLSVGVRQSGETLVCARADGEPLQPQSLTHQFTRLISRIPDIPRVRFHDLRHSHATQLLLAGVHPKVAQERLGHASITTTIDLYSHVTETMQTDAAARLDQAWRNAKMAPGLQ
jgi:integrase